MAAIQARQPPHQITDKYQINLDRLAAEELSRHLQEEEIKKKSEQTRIQPGLTQTQEIQQIHHNPEQNMQQTTKIRDHAPTQHNKNNKQGK